ncbi:DinB family protein [Acidobacteriota bacterium]
MSMIEGMMQELTQEAVSTKKMLEQIPEEHFEFKPHEKSMTLILLASHMVDILKWTEPTVTQDEFTFDPSSFVPWQAGSRAELIETFDKNLALALKLMEGCSDEAMAATWSMKVAGKTVFSMPRAAVLRSMFLNHLIHHRGQLSVYLRLKDVPLPQVYGPTADDQGTM